MIFAAAGFSQDLYQKHLPKELYKYIAQQEFFDGSRLVNSTEKQYGSIVNTITVKIAKEERGQQCAVVANDQRNLASGCIKKTINYRGWMHPASNQFNFRERAYPFDVIVNTLGSLESWSIKVMV